MHTRTTSNIEAQLGKLVILCVSKNSNLNDTFTNNLAMTDSVLLTRLSFMFSEQIMMIYHQVKAVIVTHHSVL